MNRNHFFVVFVLLSLCACLSSCKVDFSPNASWQEIPVVYCVLDQDDDTTYVRVQKCYLGEGNQYEYGQVYDSVNYPQGSIEVRILAWPAVRDEHNILTIDPLAAAPVKVFDCDYRILTDKEEGGFCAPEQPVYCCRTAGQLDTSYAYQLVVTKTSTGDTLATAQTYLIGDAPYPENTLSQPGPGRNFDFSGTTGNKVCNLRWYTFARARQYQPKVRFHYYDELVSFTGSTYDTVRTPHYVDIDCPSVKSNMKTQEEMVRFQQLAFLAAVKNSVLARNIDWDAFGDNEVFNLVAYPYVDIYLQACTEDLAAYMFSHEITDGINQVQTIYTNVRGGLGVFAARRHLVFRRPTRADANSPYLQALSDLGVGF